MKKGLLFLCFLFIGWSDRPPEKKFKFEFNEAQLNMLWNCIDNSNAPHSQVKEIEALIQSQLKTQIADTTKKVK